MSTKRPPQLSHEERRKRREFAPEELLGADEPEEGICKKPNPVGSMQAEKRPTRASDHRRRP